MDDKNLKIEEVKEVLDIISMLTYEQKKTVLDALRGAVLIADCDKVNSNDAERA